MGFKCGIVGLPNVGKSTLFNALTRTAAAQAANYPFCTIEPNTGEVAVPDPRLDKIAAIAKSKEIIPTRIAFVDIAGLVRGASKGEGLGNQFLANIREVDAIVHVLRCFEDDDITHVEGRIDPVADAETVDTELMLADLDSLERRVDQIRKRGASQGQGSDDRAAGHGRRRWSCCRTASRRGVMLQGIAAEDAAHPARAQSADRRSRCSTSATSPRRTRSAGNEHTRRGREDGGGARRRQRRHLGGDRGRGGAASRRRGARVPRSHGPARARPRPADPRRLRALGLITYFTAGPKETRAWTVHKGAKAPQAAGVIHTDFERGFIRAQTIAYDDFVALGGEVAGQGSRQGARRRQGIRRPGRRRHAVQVQYISFKRIRCRFRAARRL